MNNTFDRFMLRGVLVSIAIASLSGLLIFSFLESKEMRFLDLFQEGTFNYRFNENGWMDDVDDMSVSFSSSSSRFDIKDIYEEDVFEIRDRIQINSTIEEINFVHEDREDIMVTYEREIPDTSAYQLTYNAYSTSDQIIVDVKMNTVNLYMDRDYNGLITLYLPMDYACESLTIQSVVADHQFELPSAIENLSIDVDFGALDVTIDQPLNSLKLSIDAGDMDFNINNDVDVVTVNVDAGELTFTIDSAVLELTATNDMGQIIGDLKQSPKYAEVLTNLGSIDLSFDEPIQQLKAGVDIGDLSIDVSSEDDGLVHASMDMGDVNSVLKTTSDKEDANIRISANIGNISVK